MEIFTENQTELCGCCDPKTKDEIYCGDCANFWQSTLGKDNLPFANSNSKVSWMNEMLNCWTKEVKALHEGRVT
jgi:hypothetical protein